jgi:hypothetical protein
MSGRYPPYPVWTRQPIHCRRHVGEQLLHSKKRYPPPTRLVRSNIVTSLYSQHIALRTAQRGDHFCQQSLGQQRDARRTNLPRPPPVPQQTPCYNAHTVSDVLHQRHSGVDHLMPHSESQPGAAVCSLESLRVERSQKASVE